MGEKKELLSNIYVK